MSVAVGETYGKGSREMIPALEGPNLRSVNPSADELGCRLSLAVRRLKPAATQRLLAVGPSRGHYSSINYSFPNTATVLCHTSPSAVRLLSVPI